MPPIYVAILTYVRPLEEIDRHVEAHIEWLRRHYADGTFLLSGRRVPRTGGVIVTRGESLEAVEALLKTDPFQQHGLATVDIIPLQVAMAADGLKELLLGA
ncbi:YciI family protein [Shinella zoogloeoides]|uniref:YciI family protein n=1 Tax=Shinella zoogloeoides TaxID=352475 RepID=UPI003D6ABEA6